MKCPKCGHEQINSVECESCGIFFAKYRQAQETQQDLPALRSSHVKPAKQPPYVIIAVAAGVLLVVLILVFGSSKKPAPVKPAASVATPLEQPTAQVSLEDEAKYRYYKKLTGYNLDRTLLRFQPAITTEHGDEFNYQWMRAYNCEYAGKIQQDRVLFKDVMRKFMDDELHHRNSYPTKYQYKGDIKVRLASADRGVITISPEIRVRTYIKGSAERGGPGCADTQNMNTEHFIRFPPFRHALSVDVPTTILQKIDFQGRPLELEADIKFRIEQVTYEYRSGKPRFDVMHQAVIEKLDLLNNENAPREERIFVTLSESQLY